MRPSLKSLRFSEKKAVMSRCLAPALMRLSSAVSKEPLKQSLESIHYYP